MPAEMEALVREPEAVRAKRKISKTKYPRVMKASAKAEPMITGSRFLLFLAILRKMGMVTPAIRAVMALMIKVAGAYIRYPPKRSESMDPNPAAKPPYRGPKRMPDRRTKASPGWTYPKVGVGILMKKVPTKVRAAKSAVRIILRNGM